MERRVTPEDEVSERGGNWHALATRPDLAVFFEAVRRLDGITSTPAPKDAPPIAPVDEDEDASGDMLPLTTPSLLPEAPSISPARTPLPDVTTSQTVSAEQVRMVPVQRPRRTEPAPPQPQDATPVWVWFVAAVMVGLALALLYNVTSA